MHRFKISVSSLPTENGCSVSSSGVRSAPCFPLRNICFAFSFQKETRLSNSATPRITIESKDSFGSKKWTPFARSVPRDVELLSCQVHGLSFPIVRGPGASLKESLCYSGRESYCVVGGRASVRERRVSGNRVVVRGRRAVAPSSAGRWVLVKGSSRGPATARATATRMT